MISRLKKVFCGHKKGKVSFFLHTKARSLSKHLMSQFRDKYENLTK